MHLIYYLTTLFWHNVINYPPSTFCVKSIFTVRTQISIQNKISENHVAWVSPEHRVLTGLAFPLVNITG